MTIAVAVSGGADSLYALVSLHEQGEQVIAVHGRFHGQSLRENPALPGLTRHCERLHIPLHLLDLREQFEQRVVTPFVHAYAEGQTPNPCALCNARIKFGLLMDEAMRLGADRLATGHYAGLITHPLYGPVLCKGADAIKDQSYFLSLVPRERLSRAIFPLAALHKTDIRAELAKRGLEIPVPQESQEICFVPRDDYRAFLLASGHPLPGSGPICTREGQRVGAHQGLWNHTEGQRRGLGIAWPHPLYVTGKDVVRNTLIVGSKDDLLSCECTAHSANMLVDPRHWPETCLVRVRYRQGAEPATVRVDADTLHIRFLAPQPPSAPGQVAAVFDDEGHVLAGALICDMDHSSVAR